MERETVLMRNLHHFERQVCKKKKPNHFHKTRIAEKFTAHISFKTTYAFFLKRRGASASSVVARPS